MRGVFNQLGRRGIALLLLGTAWATNGLAHLLIIRHDHGNPREIPHESLPPDLLAWLWILAGLGGVLFGMRGTGRDTPGFLAVSTMPLLLAGSYAVSWSTWLLSGGDYGWRLGALGAVVWLALLGLIGLVASWAETPGGGDT